MVLVDASGNDIPMEEVYVSQLILFEEIDESTNNIRVLASSGDESSKPPTNLGTVHAVKAETDRNWGLKWNFFNIWGAASNAPIDVYIKVSVLFTPLKTQISSFTFVEWDMLGVSGETSTSPDVTFNVPGTGGIISKEITGIFLEDTTIVMAWGKIDSFFFISLFFLLLYIFLFISLLFFFTFFFYFFFLLYFFIFFLLFFKFYFFIFLIFYFFRLP